MPENVLPVTEFKGLNLTDDPASVGPNQAIDLLNVDLDKRGRVRVRDGLVELTGSATNINSLRVWDRIVGSEPSPCILHTDGTNLTARTLSGGSITTAATTATLTSLAALGTGAAGPYAYLALGTGAAVRRFDGSAFASPAGMPSAKWIAVQPSDNRLVAANTSAGASRVSFSDAGAPETWGANNYVDLDPNDGQQITGMAVWGGHLFVFKQSKFAVFYGNSTDSDGEPIFNYRWVNAGVGAWSTDAANSVNKHAAVAADPTGIYFLHQSGVYRTTGGPPEKLSRAIDPIFNVTSPSTFLPGSALDLQLGAGIAAVDGKVYVPIGMTGSALYWLVYDAQDDLWTIWNATKLRHVDGPWRVPDKRPTFLTASAAGSIAYASPTATADSGTAIVSRYRSGFYELPRGERWDNDLRINKTEVWGTGTPSLSVSSDFGSVPTSGGGAKTALALGTSPAIGRDWHRKAQSGRFFSYQLEATSGAWTVNQLTHSYG